MKVCPAHSSITFNTNASGTKSLIFTEIIILRRQRGHTYSTSDKVQGCHQEAAGIFHGYYERGPQLLS